MHALEVYATKGDKRMFEEPFHTFPSLGMDPWYQFGNGVLGVEPAEGISLDMLTHYALHLKNDTIHLEPNPSGRSYDIQGNLDIMQKIAALLNSGKGVVFPAQVNTGRTTEDIICFGESAPEQYSKAGMAVFTHIDLP